MQGQPLRGRELNQQLAAVYHVHQARCHTDASKFWQAALNYSVVNQATKKGEKFNVAEGGFDIQVLTVSCCAK